MIPLRLYAYAAVALALVGLIWHDRHVTGKLRIAESTIQTAIQANESQVTAIALQSKALAAWKALGPTPEDVAKALAAANDRRTKAERLASTLSKIKETDRELPDCSALLATNVQRACPGIAYGLRSLENGNEIDRGRSSGTSYKTAPVKPNRRLRAEVPIPRN